MEKQFLFLADVHLGRLARMLRMLGFDTKYRNNYNNDELMQIAEEENRILLSRNSHLDKNKAVQTFLIMDENPERQLKQVIEQFHLAALFQPFTRCIVCNGRLESKAKQTIAHLLEENTGKYFLEFWQCASCNRIYWKGSHYERMQTFVKAVKAN